MVLVNGPLKEGEEKKAYFMLGIDADMTDDEMLAAAFRLNANVLSKMHKAYILHNVMDSFEGVKSLSEADLINFINLCEDIYIKYDNCQMESIADALAISITRGDYTLNDLLEMPYRDVYSLVRAWEGGDC